MPGGRPPKPIELVKGHRTKAEKEVRKKAEDALLTGVSLKEWPDTKNNSIAHKEFGKLKKLLKAIKKDDALYEAVINRYCLLIAECKEFEIMKDKLYGELRELEQAYKEDKIDMLGYLEHKNKSYDKIMACDRKIMEKRKMMLDIEKENIMTIASSLRSIPKKPQEITDEDPMAILLNKRAGDI